MWSPGWAPRRPAAHVPSVLVTRPCASSSAVFSPKYQTLPWESWLYQSVVRSSSRPCVYRRTWTASQGPRSIILVWWVTVTRSRVRFPSFTPVYTQRVPRRSGNQGLSTRALKFDEGGGGGGPSVVCERACGANAAPPMAVAAATANALRERIRVFMSAFRRWGGP